MCVTLDGVLDWILDLLTTYTHNSELQVIIASSLISRAFAKSFPACSVFTRRSLVRASNSGDSSASALKSFLHSFLYRTDLIALIIFLKTRGTANEDTGSLLHVYPLQRERVYRAFPEQRPYILAY
jgi:hypothetical protein